MITDPDKVPPGDYEPLFEHPKTIQEHIRGHGRVWAYQNKETLELISPDCHDCLEFVPEIEFNI